MLINFTNHPFDGWSILQKNSAIEKYGKIHDIPFPRIDPACDELDLKELARNYLQKILILKPNAVHIMGEMSFTFLMIHYLKEHNVECIASTTERIVHELDGKQVSLFNFVRFRKYHFLTFNEETEKEVLQVTKKKITLNSDQQKALQKILHFVENSEDQIFILKGYAGTGKTTILSHLIRELKVKKMKTNLMATTGRAASILKEKTNFAASTVHSLVYRFNDIKESEENAWENETGQLYLNFGIVDTKEEDLADVYIIDEASMIASVTNDTIEIAKFGTGNLLLDLLKVIKGKKVIFVGDPCQLPPVSKESFSAALSKEYFQDILKINSSDVELTQIQRQAENSDILDIASPFREMIVQNRVDKFPKIMHSKRFKDVLLVPDSISLFEKYLTAIKAFGLDSSKIISHSNSESFRANMYIRSKLFPMKSGLQVGDLLIVSQNCQLTQLNNGEQVQVVSVGKTRIQGHFTFLEVKLKALHNNHVFSTLIFEKLLSETAPNIAPEDYKALLIDFTTRMNNLKIPKKSEPYYENMRKDIFINSLKVKYGYAITLQKAQGGEWQYTFLNVTKSIFTLAHTGKSSDIARWFYTGITRAQKALYITNGFWIKQTH